MIHVIVLVCAVSVAVLSSSALAVFPTAVLAATALWLRRRVPIDSALWIATSCWLCVGAVSLVSFGLVWPIPQMTGLGAATVLLRRQGVAWPAWLRDRRRDATALALSIVSVPVTTVALVAFIASGRTDLAVATQGLQGLPLWVIPLAGLGFVLANPTVEEVLFRGALQTMIHERTGNPPAAIAAQGVAFGAVHFGGVPGGPLGMLMATGWGVLLGIVRHRTGGIRLTWVVHVLANIAIFTTVILLALNDGTL